MINLGITRRIDDLGRIVIPMETRKNFGIDVGDRIAFYVEDDKIIIKRVEDRTCPHCQKKLGG